MIGSISLQERLQMKREPLDQWSIREKLCLVTAVMRSGDQNWMSVSRALKLFGEPNRPADWFHQKNCAAQYGALLEQIDTPKRKKRSSFGGIQEPPQLETPAESILKNLQAQRQEELKQLLAEEKKEYLQLQEDMRLLQSGQVNEDQLDEWCLAIEEEERQKDLENAEYSTWLKEREQRKQELERVWRPVARPPIGLQQTNLVGQKRKAIDESLDPINTSLIVQQPEIDNSEETKKSPTVTNPETPTKPALSPLLTSLLKSPSSHQQQQQQGAPQHASILHTAITQQTPPKVASTTINPTIASLLNRSASVTVSPGIQQLVTSAISSAEPTPIPAPIINIRQSENQLATCVTDLLSDSEVPNLKDIEKTISIDHPLPEMKNEEVDTIISDLIDNNDIVTDPEKHLLDVNDDDIINSLENELEELANEEKAAIAYAAAAIIANESDCGDSHVKSMTETVQDEEVDQFVQETEHSPKVVNLEPVVLLTSTNQKLLLDIVKDEITHEEVIELPIKVATPEKSPEKTPENEVVEIKEEKAKIEIDPFEFQEDPEIQPSKPSAGLKLVTQQSQNQMENKNNNENILNELQSSKTLVKEILLRHSTETKELRKSITEIVKIEQKEIEQEQLTSTIGSVEIVEVDVLEDEENSNDSYKSKASDESNIKIDVSDIATTKPEVLSIDQKSPASVKLSPVKVEVSSTAINEDESSTRSTLVESMIEPNVDVSKTDSISEEASNQDQDLKVKEDDNMVIIAVQTSIKKNDSTEVKEAPEIKHENVESTPSRTFTPDYSNSMGDIFDDMNIGMKVSRVKRDYSRTKKKEDSADIDLLLAVEKAANENLHNDDDYDEDQSHTLEPAHPSCEGNKQHTASKTHSKLVPMDVVAQTKAKHLKEQVADDSNSPWTEEEEVAITTASSVAAPLSAHSRSTRRRYSTPATPVDSIPSSPASSFDDDRDYRNWKKAVLLVHGRLAMHKYASLFMKGVTNDQAPSYHDLVYRPMDLQTIRKNVDSGVIRTNGEFQRDVLLMLANAIMYNDVGSQIYEMAVEMRKEAHEQLQILHQAQQGGDGGPSRRERRTTDQQQQQQVVGKRKRTSETEAPSRTRVWLDEFRVEIQRRDQEILAMSAKMKTLEEQHQDYQRHIAVLKESLCAKEEHYNMLQADVEEMRQRLEEKNRLIEKKTQQVQQERQRVASENSELREHMDIKDRKINVLQRKVENLEDLLKEKDNQVDMARARLNAMQAHHCTSEGALSSLEEAIGDKEKQMAQLREQRDRAEQEKAEERELHEREIAEYKMKIHSLNSEVEKLSVRLDRAQGDRDRLESKLECSQSELGKSKAELDKFSVEVGRSGMDWEQTRQRLSRTEMENERLKQDLERAQQMGSSSAFGRTALSRSQEFDPVSTYDRADKTSSDLRRCQAELRVTQADNDRAKTEASALQEKLEKSQGEVYRLKARLENSHQEQASLREELERSQSAMARLHADKDRSTGDLEKAREELERSQATLAKAQMQQDKVQNALDKAQTEVDKLQEKLDKALAESRRIQLEKEKQGYDFESVQSQLDKVLGQSARIQKEKDTTQLEADRLRDKYEKSQIAISRLQKEKDSFQDECEKIKERLEIQLNQVAKAQRERADIETELDLIKDRWDKAHMLQQKLQIERDDAMSEIDTLKEKLDKAVYSSQKAIDDRDTINKEFEKLLEKYDRTQSDLYRQQNKLDTLQAEKDRLELEVEKQQLNSTKMREEHRKQQEELQRITEMFDRTSMQLGRTKELEEKSKEELNRLSMDMEMLRERYEKSQLDIRRMQTERDKFHSENEHMKYELERTHAQGAKVQAGYEKSQEEITRLQIEIEKTRDKHDTLQNEFRKIVGEYDALRESSAATNRYSKYDREENRTKEDNERLKAEVDRLRERLEKTLTDLDKNRKELAQLENSKGKHQCEEKERSAEMVRIRDELQRTIGTNQMLETKLHELQLQLDISKQDVTKVSVGQDKQRHELERAVIECEKLRDRHEKLKIQMEKMEKENERLKVELAQTERRQNLAADKVRGEERLEIEKLKEKLEKAIQARDATELEAGRLAQELEKSQIHLAKALETNEATKIEFERMANDLVNMHERIERDKIEWTTMEQDRDLLRAEVSQMRSGMDVQRRGVDQRTQDTIIKLQQELAQSSREREKMVDMINKQGRQGESIEKQIVKYEADIKQLTLERDQLVIQLEKSQDMLLNFQQELNNSEMELERQKIEVSKLKNEQKRMSQDIERGTKEILENRDREITKLQEQLVSLNKERDLCRQRAEKAEKRLQETGARGDNELEQWRKVVETETARADQAEKTSQDLQKRIQVMEKQLQQQLQQMAQQQKLGVHATQDDKEVARLRKELEKLHIDLKNSAMEKERLQAQLEMLVQELERNQIELLEESRKAQSNEILQRSHDTLAPLKNELDEQRKQLDLQREQVNEQKRLLDIKHHQVVEKERKIHAIDEELKRRMEQMEKMEESLKKMGGGTEVVSELNRNLRFVEKKLEKAQEEAKHSAAEMERLLQLVQMSQEEQNSKEKTIMELQQALKIAQAKMKQQQQANAQLEEQRKKEEKEYYTHIPTIEDIWKILKCSRFDGNYRRQTIN